jgi:GcrA cell cycle regulator
MLELKSKTCHWPFEDPKSDEFHFCGKPTWEGFPYCNEHAAKAYKKVKLKKKKKKA